MGTWAIVLSDGETYGELDGCDVIWIAEGADDYNEFTDSEIISNATSAIRFNALDDGRMVMELINPDKGVTDYTITLREPEA